MPAALDGHETGGSSVGGTIVVPVTTSTGGVALVPRSVQDAITEAGRSVKIIQGAAPTPANFPATAKPGELYTFTANPNYIYFLGPDNVLRALTALPVA